LLRRPSSPLFPYTTLFRSVQIVSVAWARRSPDVAEEVLYVSGWTRTGLPNEEDYVLGEPSIGILDLKTLKLDDVRSIEFSGVGEDRKSTRLNSSHVKISYA